MYMNNNIILIGFMGSGKTTIGKKLSQCLSCSLIDTDELIVKKEGRSINDIFASDGEAYFRDLETQVLRELIETADGQVISVGGGLPMREENRRLMKQLGKTVYLTASVEELVKRLKGAKDRPMLRSGKDLENRITELMNLRGETYEGCADFAVDTQSGIEETVSELIKYRGQIL